MRVDFTGRAGLLAATKSHPFARYSIADDHTVGQLDRDCVVWLAQRRSGPVVTALGDPAAALRIAGATLGATLDLPRLPQGHGEDWEFRWTFTSPGGNDARVVELTETDWPEITDLLRAELSNTTNWPGNPDLHAWYGIRDNGRLVAVAADRSRYDLGYLVAVAVAADRRRQGLAAAMVGTLTTRLLKRYDVCALSIHADNPVAAAAFTALGYRNAISRTLVRR
jgi:ribosomal protein S18 acetylase RimI-like enzyme